MTKKRLKELTHTGPVTSLHFLRKNLLLIGQGPYLSVYDLSNGAETRLAKHRVFARERVHGIIEDDGLLCIWGGRNTCLTRLDDLLASTSAWNNRQFAQISDWILHAAFVPSKNDGKCLAMITAYNNLIIQELDGRGVLKGVAKHRGSPERCILYSAYLTCLGSSKLVIAAGTVFGSILLWSHDLQTTSTQINKLHTRLLSHEGSIFGVALSQDLNYLISSSDDRSVRLWNVASYRRLLESQLESSTPQDLANSGFQAEETQSATDEKPIAIGWGHHARIWGVRFLPNAYESRQSNSIGLEDATYKPFISWSEDLSAKIWVLNDNGILTASHTYENAHSGKHIWALSFFDGRMATGGADGAVTLWNMPPLPSSLVLEETPPELELENVPRIEMICSMNEIDESYDSDLTAITGKDALRNYVVLTSTSFLASFVSGTVLHGQWTRNPVKPIEWTKIGTYTDCRNASVLGIWSGKQIAVLGNSKGQVTIFDQRREEHFAERTAEWAQVSKGRIANILTSAIDDMLYFIPNTFNEKEAINLASLSSPGDAPSSSITVEATWLLIRPDSFIVTSFCIAHLNKDELLCILGSRHGGLAAYIIPTASGPKLIHEAVEVWRRIHDQDAVTSLNCSPIPNTKSFQITSTGRIGSSLTHELSVELRPTISQTHSSKPSLLPDIQGIKQLGTKTLLYGFGNKSFILYNDTTKTEVGAGGFNCDGGNRSWAFDCQLDAEGKVSGLFVFTKAGRCHVVRYHDILHDNYVQLPGHGREIKALAVSPRITTAGGEMVNIIATGAEDTVIRLSYLNKSTKEIVPLAIEKSHTTGLQDVIWSPCGEYLFSSGGVEEVFAWRIRVLGDESGFSLGVVREGVVVTEEQSQPDRLPDLRVTGLDVLIIGTKNSSHEKGFLVATVRSNSSIQILFYSPCTHNFHHVLYGTYKTSCLLQVKFQIVFCHVFLYTAGTDGYISVWDITTQLNRQRMSSALSTLFTSDFDTLVEGLSSNVVDIGPPVLSFAVHQSSIKSLDLFKTNDGKIWMVTGGDDTAVALTRLNFRELLSEDAGKEGISFGLNEGISISHATVKMECAHASAVTAAGFLGEKLVVTGGVDQKVKLWEIVDDEDGQEFTMKVVDEKFASTPDLSAVGFVSDHDEGEGDEIKGCLVVAGVGVETFEI